MGNRWLAKHQYTPSGAECQGRSGNPRASAAKNSSPSNESFSPAPRKGTQPGRTFLSQLQAWTPFVSFLTATLSLLIAFRSLEISKMGTKYVPTPTQQTDPPLAAIKIERTANWGESQQILDSRAAGARGLFHRWNRFQSAGGAARRAYGHPQRSDPYQFYIPEPRETMEQQFADLQDQGGFSNLQLQIAHAPSSWTPQELELHKIRWAYYCHAKPELIDLWSSFRNPEDKAQMQNDCKAGGACLVVSRGECDAGAFDDLSPTSNE